MNTEHIDAKIAKLQEARDTLSDAYSLMHDAGVRCPDTYKVMVSHIRARIDRLIEKRMALLPRMGKR